MYKEAITELSHAVTLSGESTISLAMLGHASGAAGNRKEAQKILERLTERSKNQYVPSYWIAMIHVGLGDKDNAFSWLERAVQERSSWLAWAKVEPRFDSLHADPRFDSLLGEDAADAEERKRTRHPRMDQRTKEIATNFSSAPAEEAAREIEENGSERVPRVCAISSVGDLGLLRLFH
jgi:hypothetical protein